ncbi:hypothetical protein HU200_001036 [Digitaria exilis]|uniref:Inner centromere protein ARK-binding domain-containing protein n=1 Tax=Digitaria exilis TaxID=1010633 RepID=A0A835G2A1_9POAL|nr:hypothetical protein HU200_001036 [Digitaria exilis]
MEHLFMQAFERREWLAAQMQQQVDSYSQTLANSLLAAGHTPPEWLLPSTALPQGAPRLLPQSPFLFRPRAGAVGFGWFEVDSVGCTQLCAELNGKPIFLTGRHITTPAANRSIFMPLAVPSTLSINSEVPNGCTYPDSNCTALGNDIHEEEHQDQTSLSHGISEACTADKMFSRIQRSRSRQRHIEDRLNGKDQAAQSGSHDGMKDGKHMSDVGTLGPNSATAPSSSIPCDAAANIAETTSSGPGQDMDFCATQVRSIDHGVQLDGFPSHIESQIICSNSNVVVSNNSSVRDSLTVPLPDMSKASIADSVCHHIPETHMLVEPKKLQFDGIGSTCMNHTSEQTDQQQESGVKSDNLDLASIIPSTEGPSSTSSQGPHSMGRLSLDHVRLGHLNPDSAPVDQHHKYAIECSQPDLTGMHSPNKKPSLTCLAEASDAMGAPLLQKDTEHIPENYSLERAHPRVSRPLEMDTSNSDDSKFSQRPCSGFNPLLESDRLRAIEDTEKLQASNSHVSPPYCGPLQLPTQLADSRFGTRALSGTSPNSLLGEDGHLSKLPKNDRNSQYSQGRSALSLELLPAQICNSNDVCPSSLLCCRTQSTDKHSSGCAAVNNLASAGKELSQEPYLSSRSSLEFNGSIPDAETPSGYPALDMENSMLKANPVPDLVNCYSGKLCDDALISKVCGGSADDRKNESVVLKVMPSDSYQRTTEMHGTEMNCVVSSEKCNESLHQGKEQVTPHAEGDAQINADSCRSEDIERRKSEFTLESREKSSRHQEDRGSAPMRSGADGVQINGGTSCKRKRIKCKDIVLTSSYDRKPLSPNHHDVTSTHLVTGENFSGRSQPSGRYFLRSSGSGEFMSLKSETTNHKMSVASDVQQNDNSSHKLRNRSCLSDMSLCNSSSAKALSPYFDSGISSKIAVEEMDLNNYQAQLQNVFDVETTSPLPSSSNIALDNMELCKQQENCYLQGEGLRVSNSIVEQQQMSLQMDEILSKSVVINPANYSSTDSTNMFLSDGLDQHGKQVSAPIAVVHGKLSYGSSIEVDRKFRSEDLTGVLLSDDTIPRQKDDESVDFNDTMPHFESFDFSVPFDSPTAEERTFEILHDSRQFATFSPDVSKKYQMNTLSGTRQLLGTMSGKAANCSFDYGEKQLSESIDGRITGIFGSSGLGRNGSFFTSDVVAPCSSNVSDKQESSENPLTPAVEKYNLGKLSGKNGSVSEYMGSIPELSCFRIDEDTDAEENEYQDIIPGSVGSPRQSGRKVLEDITGLCQSTRNSASCSIGFMDTSHTDLTTETWTSEANHHPGRRNDCDNKKPKQSCVSLVKKEGKVSHSLHNRLSKAEARHMSEANTGKRSKPSNIVASVASFIPLVKPKVQTGACVKKDVRVKALEAAEAAKRLEEKKQNEREMRKAAAKLEREKLKHEKELKRKHEEEQKKKRDVDVATRKRQRDDEERKEKERKRKCVEEARKQQRQPMERRHANSEKDARPKPSDKKELQKNLAEAVKGQVKHDEMKSLGDEATKSNSEKVVVADERPAVIGSQSQENIPTSLEEFVQSTFHSVVSDRVSI